MSAFEVYNYRTMEEAISFIEDLKRERAGMLAKMEMLDKQSDEYEDLSIKSDDLSDQIAPQERELDAYLSREGTKHYNADRAYYHSQVI